MKKFIVLSSVIATMALATACSTATKQDDTKAAVESQESQESQEQSVAKDEETSAEETSAEAEEKEADKASDVKEVSGVVSDKKNLVFNLTDDKDKTYSFSFEEAPKGFDEIQDGDKVKVTFKGELSEVDPITDVVSIEKLDK